MRIVMWLAVTALAVWLGFYFPALWYFAGAMTIFPLICIIHGIISKPALSEEIISCTVPKNEECKIDLILSGFTRPAAAELVCTNALTKHTQRLRLKIPSSKKTTELMLKIRSEDCGKLKFSLEKLRLYDLCGLTYKTVSATMSGSVICFPDFDGVCPQTVSEYARNASAKPAGYEISGAKEYVQGDDLRHINHKLTQRFQKPYVNEFTPDDTCPLCLFFDFACESGNYGNFGRLMEKYVSCAKTLTEYGVVWQGAFFDGIDYNIRRIESTEEFDSFVRLLISSESTQRKSDIALFPDSGTERKIICFTLNNVKRNNSEFISAGEKTDE